jgi:hypothetical protein
MRHDINNHLSLIMAAVELVRRKPEALERMASTLVEQPARVSEAMANFSAFERPLHQAKLSGKLFRFRL